MPALLISLVLAMTLLGCNPDFLSSIDDLFSNDGDNASIPEPVVDPNANLSTYRGVSGINLVDNNLSGTGITVGIIDSYTQAQHPDLQANVVAVYDYANSTNNGTEIAGVIAAVKDNGLGGYGMAYNSRLKILNVITDSRYYPCYLQSRR